MPRDYQPPEYSVQWHLHRSEELYLREIGRFVREIAGPPLPADFVVFRFGRTYSHGGIVIDWPIIIHAYIPHGVMLSDALRDGELLGRQHKFFELDVGRRQPTLGQWGHLHAEWPETDASKILE